MFVKTYNYTYQNNSFIEDIDFSLFKEEKNILIQIFCGQNESTLQYILNLLQNAALANEKKGQMQLELSWQQPDAQSIALIIRDFGAGFLSSELAELGGQLMPSEQGMGIAVMLSNVTFERLQGSLTLFNHQQGGAVAKVKLAITSEGE